ncbi:MAG: DUF5995 family protein [Acidimicrobiales bacterium]
MVTISERSRTGNADAAARIAVVVDRLDEVIDWAIAEGSRIGYFAAVYRRVTETIRQDVLDGQFADGARMAELDVAFAGRFFDALDRWWAGESPTLAWAAAFEAAGRSDLAILQQLLVGINAHIRLDLGVAAASVTAGIELAELRIDFASINHVLADLVPRDRLELEQVSPRMHDIDLSSRVEDRVIDELIRLARADAWRCAEQLHHAGAADLEATVTAIDHDVARHAARLLHPDAFVRLGLNHLVTPHDDKSVAEVIRALR